MVQHNAQTQGRQEHVLEPNFEFTAHEEDYTAHEEVYTAGPDVSTAGAKVSTTSLEVSTAVESLVYIRRSAAKRKDKGKSIMKEDESVQKKKTKLQLEQERLGYEEALRLQEQLNKEERQRIARVQQQASTFNAEELVKDTTRQEQEKYDFEKALELQKQLDKREVVVAKVNQAHDIDWSDPTVLRYHALQNSIFERV
ncbi:hypothetical protein Tco_0934387 [Tanacetum coccineum]